MKAALEHCIDVKVPLDARILCWLVEFASYLVNRCDIGSDGEKMLCMPAKPARGGKCETRLHPAVFVGTLNWSSEAVVVTEQGLAFTTRAANVLRIFESESWDVDRTLGMRAVPWSRDGSGTAFDRQVGMARPAEMVLRSPREVLIQNKVART